MTRRTVIVNADDFGASTGINAGIVEAHAHGIVTSTSLMVTGRAAREAAALAHVHPGLSVGLHLDLDGEDAVRRVPLDDASAADVARPVEARGDADAVVEPALAAHPPGGQALQHDLGRHLQVDGHVDLDRIEQLGQGFGLMGGTGKAVENESPLRGVVAFESFGHGRHHQLVGDEVADRHVAGQITAELRAGFLRRPEHLPRRDVGYAEVAGQSAALGALPCTLLSEYDEPDARGRCQGQP